MYKNAPTAASIRSAKSKAVGGGRKRCTKGKPCSATCIAANEECLVDLPLPVSTATSKVVKMLQAKQAGGSGPTAPAVAPQLTPAATSSLQELSKQIGQAITPSTKVETKQPTASLGERFAQSKNVLGSGMYGIVKETDRGTVIKKGDLGVNEVDIQRRLADVRGVPKVRAVEYLSEARNGERKGIIEMDKAAGRALIDLTSKSDHKIKGTEASKVLDEYVRARRDIHTRGVAHGDMHDANVTWNGKNMGIIDFGNSRVGFREALNEALGAGGVDHAGPLIRALRSDGASSSRADRLESNLERVRAKANNPNLTEDEAKSLIGEIYAGI